MALDAGGGGALLDESGVVDDQHTAVGPKTFGDVGLQVVADLVRVPAAAGHQSLKAVRCGVTRVFGKLPAVLAADLAQEPTDIVACSPPGFHPREPGSDPQDKISKFIVPGVL
ncbi:hypothetical protein ADK34_35640 [Streptomyces viridochromogenes]|uniref:Uncharacterized protein n=1 Tax=Streptomyces viridochromogenes TaxID=1938 RepID=A0A0L8J9F5_STRVR|nr:hypothetical protein ADK34_35640 [Streptomyces viridochromogenes]